MLDSSKLDWYETSLSTHTLTCPTSEVTFEILSDTVHFLVCRCDLKGRHDV